MLHGILRPRLHNPIRWMQAAAVLAVLGLSVLLPLVTSRQQMLLLPGALGLGAVCLLFFRLPELGPIVLILVGVLVPSPPLPGGMNVAVLLLILLVVLWVGETVLCKPGHRRQTVRVVWPLAGLVLVSILSFAIGQLPWFMSASKAPMDAQFGGLAIFILAPAAFLWVGYRIRSERWLMGMTWTLVVIGAVHVLGWLFPPFGTLIAPLYQPGSVNNSMFWVWLVAMALSQGLFNPRLGMWWRAALLAVGDSNPFRGVYSQLRLEVGLGTRHDDGCGRDCSAVSFVDPCHVPCWIRSSTLSGGAGDRNGRIQLFHTSGCMERRTHHGQDQSADGFWASELSVLCAPFSDSRLSDQIQFTQPVCRHHSAGRHPWAVLCRVVFWRGTLAGPPSSSFGAAGLSASVCVWCIRWDSWDFGGGDVRGLVPTLCIQHRPDGF